MTFKIEKKINICFIEIGLPDKETLSLLRYPPKIKFENTKPKNEKTKNLHGAAIYLGSSHRSRCGFHFDPIGHSPILVFRCSVHK